MKRLEQLKAFGTTAQRAYYKRRVRLDTIAVLEDLQAARLNPEDREKLPARVESLLRRVDELVEHIPHLLNASCQTTRQWNELERLIPKEGGQQESLPL